MEDNINKSVYDYLVRHRYDRAAAAFQNDSGVIVTNNDQPIRLEQAVREHELQESLRQLSIHDTGELVSWSSDAPIDQTDTEFLCFEGNILCINVIFSGGYELLIVATGNKEIHIFNLNQFIPYGSGIPIVHSAPVLTIGWLGKKTFIVGAMDGSVSLYDITDLLKSPLHLERHGKYVVKISTYSIDKLHETYQTFQYYWATASYDKQLRVYYGFDNPTTGSPDIIELGRVHLQNNPESLLFIPSKDKNSSPMLVVSERDCCFLRTFAIEPVVQEIATYNMNEKNDTHVSFSAMDICRQPISPYSISISTSTEPLGRIIILAQNSDLILRDIWTDAPQDQFSSPRHVWRPKGDGIWVNGSDGIIRGIDIKSGKVVSRLIGHQGVVKAMWSGYIDGKEVLITGGFDRTLRVWRQGI